MKKNINVGFKNPTHQYFNEGNEYISVNKLLSLFGFDFDREFMLVYKTLDRIIPKFAQSYFASGFDFDYRRPKPEELEFTFLTTVNSLGLDLLEEIKKTDELWNLSSIKGTEFHDDRESEAHETGFIINPFDMKEYKVNPKIDIPEGWDNWSSIEFLKNLKDGAYTELLVFLSKYGLSGQIDEVLIETVGNIRYIDIGDHKTNNKKPKYENKNGTCYYPIDHLYDCTYTKYWLQVSLYAYILEQYGFTVRNLGIYHYSDYDVSTKKVITLKYLKKECAQILSQYWHLTHE